MIWASRRCFSMASEACWGVMPAMRVLPAAGRSMEPLAATRILVESSGVSKTRTSTRSPTPMRRVCSPRGCRTGSAASFGGAGAMGVARAATAAAATGGAAWRRWRPAWGLRLRGEAAPGRRMSAVASNRIAVVLAVVPDGPPEQGPTVRCASDRKGLLVHYCSPLGFWQVLPNDRSYWEGR